MQKINEFNGDLTGRLKMAYLHIPSFAQLSVNTLMIHGKAMTQQLSSILWLL
jgi:hypothetical protein